MKFNIFGLQRSGTTFLEFLLKDNFVCEVANGSNWKHTLTRVESDYITFNIYKNPYTWIESVVFRDPADLLLTSPSLLDEGYNIGHDRVNLELLAKLYNNYALSWYDECTFVRYEDLILQESRNNFLNHLPFERLSDTYNIPDAGSLFMSEGFDNKSIPYYVDGKPTRLTDTEIKLINKNISVDVFTKLGYTKL
jgi:hypothetical protein